MPVAKARLSRLNVPAVLASPVATGTGKGHNYALKSLLGVPGGGRETWNVLLSTLSRLQEGRTRKL